MPGIFLEVSSHDKDKKATLLRTCNKMAPHVTLAYWRKKDAPDEMQLYEATESDWFHVKVSSASLCLDKAIVDTFKADDGDMRHYVLMETDVESTRLLWELQQHIREKLGVNDAYKYPARPHVTHKHCSSAKEAEEVTKELNEKHMPATVFFVGQID